MASAPVDALRKKPLRLSKPMCELYVSDRTNDMN